MATKTFSIFGEIVDTQNDRWGYEDVCPDMFSYFLKNEVQDGDEIVVEINSVGGSVTAGITIHNLLKNCGHKTTARVLGLAASISSVIACGADKIEMYPNSLFMMHLPWTVSMGNSEDFQKMADTLEQYNDVILKTYKSKFNVDEDKIKEYMKNETWMTGTGAKEMGLVYDLLGDTQEFKMAACSKIPKFLHAPDNFKNIVRIGDKMNKELSTQKDNEPVVENTVQNETQETVETPSQNTVVEETVVDTITVEEANKRVSGMQSKMQSQINDLKKTYEGQIKDLQSQLESKEQELTKVNASVISLSKGLEDTKSELTKVSSALKEKEQALETLNSNVNIPNKELPTMQEGLAKCKTPSEKVAFLNSGKYKRN